MDPISCGTCAHVGLLSLDDDGVMVKLHECHRYPPTITKVRKSGRQEVDWPQVDPDIDWCGEWAKRP